MEPRNMESVLCRFTEMSQDIGGNVVTFNNLNLQFFLGGERGIYFPDF